MFCHVKETHVNMLARYPIKELKPVPLSSKITPGSYVIHSSCVDSFGIIVGVHNNLASILWAISPVLNKNTVTTRVKLPIYEPIEYITCTLKIDPERIPDDVA